MARGLEPIARCGGVGGACPRGLNILTTSGRDVTKPFLELIEETMLPFWLEYGFDRHTGQFVERLFKLWARDP
jgi:hypothetical protein